MRTTQLTFYDHHRQRYADTVSIDHAGEFMLGDYGEPGERDHGVGSMGEFKIVLHDFTNDPGLSVQVCFFGEAVPALLEFTALGGLTILEKPARDRDQFARRLLALGIRDCSDTPLPEEVPR